MKNVETFYTPQELRDRLAGMWKTDLFKAEAAKPGSFINQVIERAAKYPAFMYDMSDIPDAGVPDNEKLEWPHFYAWMGGIPKRNYPNPAISDLALLHELYHKGHMTYGKGMSFEAFKRKIWDNELESSVTSELEIYFRHPEFRELSFNQEILADRFLHDPDFMKAWLNDPVGTRAFIREQRRDAMHHDNPNDPVKHWIHNFANQNEAWALTWSHRYNQVESAMVELHKAIDAGADPKATMDAFMAWLQSPEITKGTEVPFVDEARAFHSTYMLNGKFYKAAVESGQMDKKRPRIDAMAAIKAAHPDATHAEITAAVTDPIFLQSAIPLPHFSSLDHAQPNTVKTATVGSFIVAYGYETGARAALSDEPLIAIVKRGDKGPNGEDRYGVLGGYTDLGSNQTGGEQPNIGAARELSEEARDDKGNPIISPDPDRLQSLFSTIDYRKPSLPVAAFGFSLRLEASELKALQEHAAKLENDAEYRTGVQAATGGEVKDMRMMKLSDVLAMDKASFTHPHEFEAVQTLAKQLQQAAVKQR